MKYSILSFFTFLLFSFGCNAQCTITASTNASSLTCGTSPLTSCNGILNIGNGSTNITLTMNATLDLSCLGAIQVIVNNASIDFSPGNDHLVLGDGSSITFINGGTLTGSSCNASERIYVGTNLLASCNGGAGADVTFATLVALGGSGSLASNSPVCQGNTIVLSATSPPNGGPYTYSWSGPGLSATSYSSSSTYSHTATSSNGGIYQVKMKSASGTIAVAEITVTVNTGSTTSAPAVSLTQLTCSTSTGTITITSPTGSGIKYSINGLTYTNTTGIFSSLSPGTYSVSAKNSSGCISSATSVTINAQPATPVKPTLGSVTQPTCSVATGSFSITNYSASYIYAVSPSTVATISGSTITAAAGSYTVTATLGSCTSVASASITVNGQPTDTWSVSGWSTGFLPTSSQKIVFAYDYSSYSDITGCSCQVSSGTVIINSGHTLKVTNDVKVTGGSLTFDDGASLVQTNDAAVNSGNITYQRETTALKQYDYTYWSSPVVSAPLSQLTTNSLFYNFNPTINNWVYQTAATTMIPGVGYIGRAPSNLTYSPTQIVETSFVGTPNNGVINSSIVKSTGTYSLIGNPYPSAIDVDLFITANTSTINGTVYFWTHNTAITNNVYTANDYAKYNLTGAVRTSISAVTGGALPTGKIAAGQGFFIEAKTSLANGTYSTTFNDAMRISGNNSQFFKNATPATTTNSISEGLERHRVWLSLRSSLGAYSQMLLGYIQGATNDFDSLFDGKTFAVGNSVSIYTKIGADNLAIQGKSLQFSETDAIPVDYSTTLNGELSVNLDDFDGLFTSQNVYLLDKTTNTFHDLKEAPYTFVTTSGNFEDRFELRFTNEALGTTLPTTTDKDIKIITTTSHQLEVISPAMAINKIEVYDILGKLLFSQNGLNTNLFQTNSLQIARQVLLVKVAVDNKQIFTKKAIIQ